MLTFDLEHWHSATLLQSSVDEPVDRIEESVDIVLDLLRKHDVAATFFVVGEVAEEYPELVERVRREGHELASHGYSHTPLFDLTPEEFGAELERAAEAIKRAAGVEPLGFRAPNFSVTRATEWAFDVLESKGYRYDSSVFPMNTPMYGVPGAPVHPYLAGSDDPFRDGTDGDDGGSLVEFPVSVVDAPIRFPVSGGFYARVLPERVLKWGIERLNRRGIPANLYFHPWEFNPNVRLDSLKLHKRFVSYYGMSGLGEKLDNLLSAYNFNTARSVLGEGALLDLEDRKNIERAVGTNNFE